MGSPPRRHLPRWALIPLAIGSLYLLLVAIGVIGDDFKALGEDVAEGLFEFATNPFITLIVGILATAIIQSSSTTTAIVVTLVGRGQYRWKWQSTGGDGHRRTCDRRSPIVLRHHLNHGSLRWLRCVDSPADLSHDAGRKRGHDGHHANCRIGRHRRWQQGCADYRARALAV